MVITKTSSGRYPHENLIKPDVEDPEAFFIFTPTGAIRPRANLPPHDQHRAEETIGILCLDGKLNQIRRAEVAGYIQTAEEFAEMAKTCSEDEWLYCRKRSRTLRTCPMQLQSGMC